MPDREDIHAAYLRERTGAERRLAEVEGELETATDPERIAWLNKRVAEYKTWIVNVNKSLRIEGFEPATPIQRAEKRPRKMAEAR